MNRITKTLISLIFLAITSGLSISQEKPIILSSKVGEQIDAGEREKYGILNWRIIDFKSAVFYRTVPGKYIVKISYLDSDKNTRDTIIDIDESTLFNIALRVQFFEDINEGIRPLNPKFLLDSAGNKYAVKISNVYPDKLPFVRSNKKSKYTNPAVGFGSSISYVSVDLSPVQNYFEQVENTFRQQGWNIPKNNLNFDVSSMYAFNFYLHIYETIGLDFETGKSMNSDADLWYSAGYLCYNLDLKRPGGIKPFAAIGVGKYSYYIEGIYNATVDPSGAYLEKITSSGSATGYFFKTGCEIGPSAGGKFLPFCFNVFAVYSYFPEIKSVDYGYTTTVKLGGLRLGGGIRLYI